MKNQDIESLGWRLTQNNNFNNQFEKNEFKLIHWIGTNTIIIRKWKDNAGLGTSEVIYQGPYPKSINDFKIICGWLDIKSDER